MTPEQMTALVQLTADLYIAVEQEEHAHAQTRAALVDVRGRVEEQDRRIAQLQGLVEALVPSPGNPPIGDQP